VGRREGDRSVLRISSYRAQGGSIMITWQAAIKQKSRAEISSFWREGGDDFLEMLKAPRIERITRIRKA
jgi:hypothetical protein